MFFETFLLRRVGTALDLKQRENLLQLILLDFRKAFPTIEFELHARSQTINAQAIIHDETRIVRLYGGLAFHSLAGHDLLVFALLHEVGHHLCSGGRLAFCESLGCECAADRWVLRRGISNIRKRSGRTLDIEKAVANLDALEKTAMHHRSSAGGDKVRPIKCWALHWRRRKAYLVGQNPMPAVPRCRLSEFYVRQFNQRNGEEKWVG